MRCLCRVRSTQTPPSCRTRVLWALSRQLDRITTSCLQRTQLLMEANLSMRSQATYSFLSVLTKHRPIDCHQHLLNRKRFGRHCLIPYYCMTASTSMLNAMPATPSKRWCTLRNIPLLRWQRCAQRVYHDTRLLRMMTHICCNIHQMIAAPVCWSYTSHIPVAHCLSTLTMEEYISAFSAGAFSTVLFLVSTACVFMRRTSTFFDATSKLKGMIRTTSPHVRSWTLASNLFSTTSHQKSKNMGAFASMNSRAITVTCKITNTEKGVRYVGRQTGVAPATDKYHQERLEPARPSLNSAPYSCIWVSWKPSLQQRNTIPTFLRA